MTTLAIGYYTAHEYERFKASAKDPDSWSKDYSEWLANAEKTIGDLEKTGKRVEKIWMNLVEFELWCLTKGLQNDAQARSRYAAEISQIKDSTGLS